MKSLAECSRTVWSFSRPVRWRVVLTMLVGILRIAVSLGFVWASKHLVDIATGISQDPLRTGIGLFLGILDYRLILILGLGYDPLALVLYPLSLLDLVRKL